MRQTIDCKTEIQGTRSNWSCFGLTAYISQVFKALHQVVQHNHSNAMTQPDSCIASRLQADCKQTASKHMLEPKQRLTDVQLSRVEKGQPHFQFIGVLTIVAAP